ncbi:MAG: SurA N-terminal domain-containing protein [Brevinematales bacterium]|nr:SurA N-terminal domain-containing protein [Brevinematales bacterium]
MDVIAVNGKMITDRDIDRALIRYIVQLEEDDRPYEPTKENLKFLRVEASNALISRLLLLERAKRQGCMVSDEDVDGEMETIRSSFESIENWENNLILFQLSENEVREEVRGDMLIERLIDMESAKEPITEELVSSFYEMNAQFLRDPTLYTFYEISASTRENLEEIVRYVRTTQDMIDLENYVKGKGETFLHHVDVVEGSIPEEVRAILSDIGVQEIGTMVLPDGGYVVYKLISRREGKQRSLESVREDVKRYLEKERRTKAYERLLDEEMEKADIRYLHVEYFENR